MESVNRSKGPLKIPLHVLQYDFDSTDRSSGPFSELRFSIIPIHQGYLIYFSLFFG